MKTNVYFAKTNAYNAVIFDRPEENYCLIMEGNSEGYLDGVVDLYEHYDADSERTVEQIVEELKHHLFAQVDLLDPTDTYDTHFDYDDADEFFEDFEELIFIGSYEN